MRIGVLADIHGNVVALKTVLDDLAGNVDRLVCLGDVAALGPHPSGVVAQLAALDCPIVLGNTDAWMLDPDAIGDGDPQAELRRWCATQLTEADLATLRAAAPTVAIDLDGAGIFLCCHGSPRSYDDVISAMTSPDQLDAWFSGFDATLIAGGHTHVPLLRHHAALRFINPGSVGLAGVGPGTPDLPLNRDVAWADYAVVTADSGRLDITFHRVPLDVAAMLDDARATGMPLFDWWSSKWRR